MLEGADEALALEELAELVADPFKNAAASAGLSDKNAAARFV